ncbi:hypothetical protein [Micromonospora carbonacea]|uniref:Uncharacterized protein n=1 Tax=Micromonospora carbonacea TaxID=47853 RepID=A0A1C5AC22_9ACTN|nr:hypothetical protein [Micromonospora carbonacea]SCF42753.1 hypothetical protein GA0070563_112125 [Micromonospora carbonacea]
MSDATYQIVGECAYVSTDTPSGRTRVLLYKGALVPGNAPELKHLLDTGLVVKVGGDETGGVNADGLTTIEADDLDDDVPRRDSDGVLTSTYSSGEQPTGDQSDADSADSKRAAAQAKLPKDGSMPHPNAGQPVWVEWHVKQGGDYDDLAKQDKADLVKLAQQRQQ